MRVLYLILLVLGGLVLALIPAVPNVELAPELVSMLFPPLPERGWPIASPWAQSSRRPTQSPRAHAVDARQRVVEDLFGRLEQAP